MADEMRVQQTIAAIYPTRVERVLLWIVRRAYHLSERGPCGWIGDRADDMRVWSQNRRASRKVHFGGGTDG